MKHHTTPYFLSQIIGYQNLINQLFAENRGAKHAPSNYPPFNIQVEGNKYVITMAVAGFSKKDLSIQVEKQALIVKGENSAAKAGDDDRNFVHRGLASRDFETRFTISEHVKVKGANLENGILEIYLEEEIPEKEVSLIQISDSRPEVPFLGKPSEDAK